MRDTLQWSVVVLLCAALAEAGAFAQTGGGLQGKVTDESGQPVIGATIQVTGPALPGFQGAVTDANGEYRIPDLPPGKSYQLTINLPFKLNPDQSTPVVATSPSTINLKKVEAGAVISDTMINNIPLGRSSANIAYLAPGAVGSGLGGQPSINGASGPENNYVVNGMDVTGAGDGLNLTALNFDFIEATEVKTGGMDAEYGALMGGAVNSITKSGGNEFKGGLFMYYWSDKLSPQYRRLDNRTIVNYWNSQKIWDVGGYLGGYIIKDKLWFFVAYDYNRQTENWSADGTDTNLWLNGQPSYSWARATGYENQYKDPQYALKLTWNVSANHKLAMSFFGDSYKADTWGSLNNLMPVASGRRTEENNYALSFQWNATWTPKFFTEAIIGTRRTFESSMPTDPAAMANYRYYYRYGSGTYAGYQVMPVGVPVSYNGGTGQINLSSWLPSLGGGSFENTKDYNDQLRLKATNIFTLAGKHELSYGLQYYDITYDYYFNYTGLPVTHRHTNLYDPSTGGYLGFDPWTGASSPGGAVVRWQYRGFGANYRYRAQYFMNDQNKQTSQKYYAYWAQDNWNLTDYFMIKLGVRLDQIHMRGGNNTKNVPHDLTVARLGSDPYNFSNGIARQVNINDEWAPRLGFTWDVAHNGKSKLYGFAGYYYERIPNDMAIRALTDEYFTFEYFNDAALTTPASISFAYGLHPTQITGGPNGGSLKGSYNEEYLLGFQYEVRPNLNLGVRAIYRTLGRAIEDISLDGGMTYIITNPDAWSNVYQWLPRTEDYYWDPVSGTWQPNQVYGWYNFPKPTRIYRALEITLDKRFSNHWQLSGSYVLSRLEGNYEGLFSNDNGQLDPNITSKYDLPQLLKYAYGPLPNDRTHVLKVYGGYNFDWGLDLSGAFTLQSGTPISQLGADDFYGINEGFVSPRGSAGRTPTIWALDVGAQYNVKLFKTNLGLRLDVFNLTNEQRTTAVDQTYNAQSVAASVPNTAGTQLIAPPYPYYKMPTSHQFPRQIRLAVRWTF